MALVCMSFGMVTLITQDGESLLFDGPNLRNRGETSVTLLSGTDQPWSPCRAAK